MIGKIFSHYKILEKLGVGGMGVVYKAEDTKLKRNVALKFLPAGLTRDMEAKARFIREAQTASALQHHNICTIHDIDETEDGQLFIIMECYEGKTLKDKIKEERLKPEEAIDIAIQIARGLQKAHDMGIVHRDIKPANIFITSDGVAKILDFGLAKLVDQVQITKDSSTLGTVAYMSPEQCSGSAVDHRTDIWSLGVVLYEMLTGERPFVGDYEQAIVYAILNEAPKPLIISMFEKVDFSLVLEQIVNGALLKNPNERYRDMEEMLNELRSLEQFTHLPSRGGFFSKATARFLWYILPVIFLVILSIMGYWLARLEEEMGFRIKRTLPLTSASGLEQDPSWSPEGTRIAYASDETGNMDIWVQQIAAGQRVNLTKNYMGYDGKPAWSPDGDWIAFVSDRNGGGIFMMPALGGIPKRVVKLSFAPSLSYLGAIPTICWSPDGTKLAYASKGTLHTIPAGGGTPTSIPLPPIGLIVGYSEPAWSPDGKRIACTGFVAVGVSTSQIWSVKPDGTDLIPITRGRAFDSNPIWSQDQHGGQIFF
ncbi:MAG: protein kinase, partial [Calditrichia bacterium]